MPTNDRMTVDSASNGIATERRTASEPTVAPGASETPLGGVRGAASTLPKPNRVVLESLTGDVEVRIEVGGEIAKGHFADDDDAIRDGNVAVARMGAKGDVDSFRFSGATVDFEVLNGDVNVTMDVETTDPDGTDRPNRLGIHAQGPHVDYRFDVSGDIEPLSGGAADVDHGTDGAVTGTVAGSRVDEYLYNGEITDFQTSSDDVILMLNDEVVYPDDVV